jgi:hypothetical protein
MRKDGARDRSLSATGTRPELTRVLFRKIKEKKGKIYKRGSAGANPAFVRSLDRCAISIIIAAPRSPATLGASSLGRRLPHSETAALIDKTPLPRGWMEGTPVRGPATKRQLGRHCVSILSLS